MVIVAKSAAVGGEASVMVNGEKVEILPNPFSKNADNLRGLHVVMIGIETGNVEFSRVFDTFHSSTEFDNFIEKFDPKAKSDEM